jgi:hypothetical protein
VFVVVAEKFQVGIGEAIAFIPFGDVPLEA